MQAKPLKVLLVLITLSIYSKIVTANIFLTKERGSITEFDKGSPSQSLWTDLFAETPNYRAFGDAIISGRGEKFRWKMGPMFYRGRLTPNSVKIFVIGQEGAQDENLSNRSFTGSTGTRMQKFLNYFGITKSYLYMNTFVYTITGQYSLYGDDATNEYKKKQWKQLMWLAQSRDSVIVQHRHKMFNYMRETNKKTLSLIIGVGTAGKESTVTWLNSISPGSCSYRKLTSSFCEGKGTLKGVLAIGVRHPGSASARNAGSAATGGLVFDFKKKAEIVSKYIKNDSKWLVKDDDGKRDFTKQFKYGYASIPHRDFPFGTPWTLGKKGTTSNRRSSDAIQIFSNNGCYNNGARVGRRCLSIPPGERPSTNVPDERVQYLHYKNPKNLINKNDRPSGFTRQDVPYEPPKNKITRVQFDKGPQNFVQEMMDFYLAVEKATYKEEMTQHHSFGPTGIYRGNTEDPEFLILADQQGHTDMFSGRALTGEAGQRLQAFLNASGFQNKYLIIRTLPVDCLDDQTKKLTCIKLLEESSVVEKRNILIRKIITANQLKGVLSFGEQAEKIINKIGLQIPVYHVSPTSQNLTNDFNILFDKLQKASIVAPGQKYIQTKLSPIPRSDLPFSARWWMGTSGDRVSRATNMENVTVSGSRVRSYDEGDPNGDYYKLYAPSWASSWKFTNRELSPGEIESIKIFKQTEL
jgi:uracil-DNA glycosylase